MSGAASQRDMPDQPGVFDLLDPLDPVSIGGILFLVDRRRPVAALVDETTGDLRFATWHDAPLSKATTDIRLLVSDGGLWIGYHDADGLAYQPDALTSLAVRISLDGETIALPLGERRITGCDSIGVWSAEPGAPTIDDTYRGGPVASDWSEPTTLVRARLDGATDSVEVDRFVYEVYETAGRLVVAYAPTPPIATPSDFGSVGYSYQWEARDVGSVADPPRKVATAVGDGALLDRSATTARFEAAGQRVARTGSPARAALPISLSGVTGTRWLRAPLTHDDIVATEQAALRIFSDLDTYWHGEDGTVRALSRGLSEGSARIEGAWPDSRVVVRFRHPHYREGLLERGLQLFDAAGRIQLSDYAPIHLMEDLGTRELPPVTEAVDGILRV